MATISLPLELMHPSLLLLLPLAWIAQFLWGWYRRGKRPGLAVRRFDLADACRAGELVLLVVALAGPLYWYATREKVVVCLADHSASVGSGAAQRRDDFCRKLVEQSGGDRVLVIPFAGRCGTADEAAVPADPTALDRMASNPARALWLASLQPSDGYVPRLVLLTDGLQTEGDLLYAAQRLTTPISVVPLEAFEGSEVAILSARTDPTGDVATEVSSNRPAEGKLEFVGGDSDSSQSEKLPVGTTSIRRSIPASLAEAKLVAVELSGFPDTIAENNRCTVFPRRPAQPPLLLLVTPHSEGVEPIAAALRTGFRVEIVPPEQLRQQLMSSKPVVVVLLDVPAESIAINTGKDLAQFVRGGGGLVVAGGEDVFHAEELKRRSLEDLLPVRVAQRTTERQSSLAMVLIIDRSKSMLDQNRLEMAKQAAAQTVHLLGPRDQVGLLAFGTETEWISPLGRCDDQTRLIRQIESLQAEGLTNMAPALRRALLALKQTDADRRHIILLTDGVPSPGDFEQIARETNQAGITISTVTVGQDADRTILEDIARLARGKYYHCDDPSRMSEFLQRETEQAVAEAAHPRFQPYVLRLPRWFGETTQPTFGAVQPTDPRPGAELWLITPEGDPLLAWHRLGRGMVVAIPTDPLSESNQSWRDSPQFDRFWNRLAHYTAASPAPVSAELAIHRTGSRAYVELNAYLPQGDWAGGLTPKLILDRHPIGAGSKGRPGRPPGLATNRPMQQVAPGRYRFEFDAVPGNYYSASVWFVLPGSRGQGLEVYETFDYPDELIPAAIDKPLLQQVAAMKGGLYDPSAAEVLAARPEEGPAYRSMCLWPYLTIAALVLLVAEAALVQRRY